jgi:CRP-like cAMP-binding protein
MFMGLDDKDMNTVIDAMESHHVKAGTDVITEGEAGNVLYIVESGE